MEASLCLAELEKKLKRRAGRESGNIILAQTSSGALAKTGKMGIISGDGWVVALSIIRDVPQNNTGLPPPLNFYSRRGVAAVEFEKLLEETFPNLGGSADRL